MKQQFLEIEPEKAKVDVIKTNAVASETSLKTWLIFPLLGCFLFGFASYVLSYIMREINDTRYQYGQCFGLAISSLSFHIVYFGINIQSKQPLLAQYEGVFKTDEGKYRTQVIITFLARVITQGITLKFFTLVPYYAYKADTSPGVMFCLTAFASVISAFVYYILYKEKLTKIQMASVCLLILSLIFISASKSFSSNTSIGNEDKTSIAVPILCALGLTTLIAMNQILGKITMTQGYLPLFYTADFMLCQSLILLPLYIFQQIQNPYDQYYIFLMILQAIIFYLAQIFQNLGLRFGKIGLNVAIVQNSAVVQFCMEVLLDGRVPNAFEICGLVLSVIAISLNAFRK